MINSTDQPDGKKTTENTKTFILASTLVLLTCILSCSAVLIVLILQIP